MSPAAGAASARPSCGPSRSRERGVGFIDIAREPSLALEAELTAAGRVARFFHADLTDTDALRAAIAGIRAAHGPVTALINNAAHDERHAAEEVTPEYFDQRIAVNLKHVFFASQAVLPDMKTVGGSIVNFSSVSWLVGMGGMAIYTAAKSAMLGLTRSLARDFGPSTCASTPSRQAGSAPSGRRSSGSRPRASARCSNRSA